MHPVCGELQRGPGEGCSCLWDQRWQGAGACPVHHPGTQEASRLPRSCLPCFLGRCGEALFINEPPVPHRWQRWPWNSAPRCHSEAGGIC